MKLMTKIKELLAGREKLKKYDELKDWKNKFENMDEIPSFCLNFSNNGRFYSLPLPDHIKELIVNALDAEIKKIDEE